MTDWAARKARLILELRREGIADTRVLTAIERVPRERFVMPAFVDQAYDNIALPIENGQTISQPFVVAFMTEALQVGEKMRVLEIGTGSGYQAAVLSHLCRRVYTIERHRGLLDKAKALFEELGLHNISARFGDGTKGWPEAAPFDRIMVTAAAPEVPKALVEELAVGGIMVVPVGITVFDQQIVRVRRGEKDVHSETLLPVRFVPLVEGVGKA
ncbi:MAG: protein-L-isoaspartate(D-aspartate) O-methyltransferase [Alphaproteobacteria bacterium]|nr:protein-L-isoaspartate(D-aspartate) O-methyltransferase [Alphaproteobacteria bacterium]